MLSNQMSTNQIPSISENCLSSLRILLKRTLLMRQNETKNEFFHQRKDENSMIGKMANAPRHVLMEYHCPDCILIVECVHLHKEL